LTGHRRSLPLLFKLRTRLLEKLMLMPLVLLARMLTKPLDLRERKLERLKRKLRKPLI